MPEYSGPVTHVELANVPIWLIVLMPFLGAAINALFGRKLQASSIGKSFSKSTHTGSFLVSAVAVGAMVIAFVLTLVNVVQLFTISEPGHRYLYTYAWQLVRIGSLDINFSFAIDTLGAVMGLVVTGVGLLIHIYATGYMASEPSYWRFFCYFNLFIFSMLLLIFGDNFVVMFFGWEGVGLCSYLLIGFWYKDYKKATCGMKAFVVNRIGDFGFVCGIALLFWGLGGAWEGIEGVSYTPDDVDPPQQTNLGRFIAVQAEPLAHGNDSHGAAADHGQDAHAAAHGTAAHGQHAPKATAHGHHAHGPGDHAHGHKSHNKRPRPSERDLRAKLKRGTSTLTFTSYPGARVYLDVSSGEQFDNLRLAPCGDSPGWRLPNGQPCYEVSPFFRKKTSSTTKWAIIVPGAGATVETNDGDEVARVNLNLVPDKETVIITKGPTLSFRGLHDQLVVKNATGQKFIADELAAKRVFGAQETGEKDGWPGIALITLACLCFFLGATGKSAQIPLFTWLPDAMAGPTPVSALIHAATMVTAGVYMVARLNFLFSISATACATVALVGAATALFAATIGFFQYDIKKVLAYSTVSQLGFMFIGVGVGAYWAAIFHLMTHAFFKACLFLGSGSVIHGMHHVVHDEAGSQDMRNMGGLKRVMPRTALTYFVACLAITAAPIPFFAGFWSKDEILWKAFNSQAVGGVPGWLIWGIGLLAALGTSFYMWRSYYLTFEGKHAKKEIAKKVHESPGAMVNVLIILAFFSAFIGIVLGISTHFTAHAFESVLPSEPLFEQWLHPATADSVAKIDPGSSGMMYALMAVAVGGAIAMWWLARKRYGADRPKNWADRELTLPFFVLLHNKYYVDEIYDRSFVRAIHVLRKLLYRMDKWIVDGLVNAAGMIARAAAWTSGVVDRFGVDGAVNFVAEGTLKAGNRLRTMQTGRIQNYVYGVLGGIVFFAILQYFL